MYLHLCLVLAENGCICGNRSPSKKRKTINHICHNTKYKYRCSDRLSRYSSLCCSTTPNKSYSCPALPYCAYTVQNVGKGSDHSVRCLRWRWWVCLDHSKHLLFSVDLLSWFNLLDIMCKSYNPDKLNWSGWLMSIDSCVRCQACGNLGFHPPPKCQHLFPFTIILNPLNIVINPLPPSVSLLCRFNLLDIINNPAKLNCWQQFRCWANRTTTSIAEENGIVRQWTGRDQAHYWNNQVPSSCI